MLRSPKSNMLSSAQAVDLRPAASQETTMAGAFSERFLIRIVRDQKFIEEILFLTTDGSLGAYGSAAKNGVVSSSGFSGLNVVRSDQLDDFLMSHLADRHDLFAFVDFANVCGDGFGNPAVFHFQWACDGCNQEVETWHSNIGELQSCPKCSRGVETENTAIEWAGPDDPFLISLWERLPSHKRKSD